MGISVTIASSEEEREERQKGGEGSHQHGEGKLTTCGVFVVFFSLPLHSPSSVIYLFPFVCCCCRRGRGGSNEINRGETKQNYNTLRVFISFFVIPKWVAC